MVTIDKINDQIEEIQEELTQKREELRELNRERQRLGMKVYKEFTKEAIGFCYYYKKSWGGDKLDVYGKVVKIDHYEGYFITYELIYYDDYQYEVTNCAVYIDDLLNKEQISENKFRIKLDEFINNIYKDLLYD